MGHLEQLRCLRRVAFGVDRARLRGSLDGDAPAPEDQQVEVELARTPALTLLPPERALEPLERGQERDRAGFGVAAGGDVQGDDGVPEFGLVGDADRLGRVEPRDAAQADPGDRRERPDRVGQRRLGVADVRPKADIRTDPSFGHAPSMRNGSEPAVPGRAPG